MICTPSRAHWQQAWKLTTLPSARKTRWLMGRRGEGRNDLLVDWEKNGLLERRGKKRTFGATWKKTDLWRGQKLTWNKLTFGATWKKNWLLERRGKKLTYDVDKNWLGINLRLERRGKKTDLWRGEKNWLGKNWLLERRGKKLTSGATWKKLTYGVNVEKNLTNGAMGGRNGANCP